MAESHCAVESWKNFSLSKEQGEASEIAGKSGGAAGLQEGPDAGIAERRSPKWNRQNSSGATEVVCSRRISLQPLMPPILTRPSPNPWGLATAFLHWRGKDGTPLGMTVVDRPTISGELLGRFHAIGLPQ